MAKSQKPRKAHNPNKRVQQNSNPEQSQQTLQVFQQQFSGPMPHPEMLQYYEDVHPGFTSHLLEEQKQERLHRQKTEVSVQKRNLYISIIGMVCALIVVAAFVGLVWFALKTGHSDAVGSIVGFPMVGIIAIFITRKYFQKKEEE